MIRPMLIIFWLMYLACSVCAKRCIYIVSRVRYSQTRHHRANHLRAWTDYLRVEKDYLRLEKTIYGLKRLFTTWKDYLRLEKDFLRVKKTIYGLKKTIYGFDLVSSE